MLRGAIFDFDGTLFDSMFVWETAGDIFLASHGLTATEDLQEALRTLSLYDSACYLRENYGLALSPEEIVAGINRTVEHFYFQVVQPKPGAAAFLEALRARGVKLALATATDRYLVEAALRRCDMDRFFPVICTCGELGHGKGEPQVFRAALAALGTTRENTLVLEDACHALETAKADGFRTVGVYDAHESRREALRAAADFFLEDYQDTVSFWAFASQL